MNIETIKTLDQINSSRTKIYYNLKSLESITMLSTRALKYRMKIIKEKYRASKFLLYKEGRAWNIHYSLISEFLPRYMGKKSNIYTEKWITEFSWNTKSSYNESYHIQLLNDLKTELSHFKVGYSLEKDRRGYYHVHGISYGGKDAVSEAIKKVISRYEVRNEFRIQVEDIRNKYSYIEYMKKLGEIKFI